MSVGYIVLLAVLGAAGLRRHPPERGRRADPAPPDRTIRDAGAAHALRAARRRVRRRTDPEDRHRPVSGRGCGLLALPIAAVTGLIIPAGPVIAFAIAAVFAKAGASVPALVTFVTSWSLYAAHRILIYEIPLLGPSFLRLRALSVLVLPFMAGALAVLVGLIAAGAGMPHIR